jgi:HEAT repeat protein
MLGAVSPRVHPTSPEWPAEREAWLAAGHVAQAAHSLEDLAALVTTHDDFRVRCEAIPRLRARFPADERTLAALAEAARAFDPVVREMALGALGDFGGRAAADVIVARLTDRDPEVRAAAGQALAQIGDPRAPTDLDEWLRLNRSTDHEDCGE